MLQMEKSDFYFTYSCMKLALKKMGGIPSISLDKVAEGMVDVTVGKFQSSLL